MQYTKNGRFFRKGLKEKLLKDRNMRGEGVPQRDEPHDVYAQITHSFARRLAYGFRLLNGKE